MFPNKRDFREIRPNVSHTLLMTSLNFYPYFADFLTRLCQILYSWSTRIAVQ
jgi:hypothetical protein